MTHLGPTFTINILTFIYPLGTPGLTVLTTIFYMTINSRQKKRKAKSQKKTKAQIYNMYQQNKLFFFFF